MQDDWFLAAAWKHLTWVERKEIFSMKRGELWHHDKRHWRTQVFFHHVGKQRSKSPWDSLQTTTSHMLLWFRCGLKNHVSLIQQIHYHRPLALFFRDCLCASSALKKFLTFLCEVLLYTFCTQHFIEMRILLMQFSLPKNQ